MAEALACITSLVKAKLNAVTIHVMYHSTQTSNACKESTLKVRESRVGGNHKEKPRVRKAKKPCGGATLRKEPQEGLPFRRKGPKVRKGREKLLAGESRSRCFEAGMGVGARKRRSSTAPAVFS
eukprot:4825396-Pleurochrysis_carterae.AAC.2